MELKQFFMKNSWNLEIKAKFLEFIPKTEKIVKAAIFGPDSVKKRFKSL